MKNNKALPPIPTTIVIKNDAVTVVGALDSSS
eukprot:CAMPEP_0195264562 /NCGR_PEP_ID=MMETSP0706-20130129/10929_1 /TAXON_ID=33640 /ORGANISM="Asterionellopsis glacialis, Strain CCMP134" /LENGTH=31 /DNA_ID= /DNA_START= /DNA_END= /DNA_ORIENTATION=